MTKWLERIGAFFGKTPIERSSIEQVLVDRETQKMVLYQAESCPFCCKVRRAIRYISAKY